MNFVVYIVHLLHYIRVLEGTNHLVKRVVTILGLLRRGSLAGSNQRAKKDDQNYY